MVITTAIKILYATSNSCKLSFHVLTKKFIDGKPLKSCRKKYSVHVSVHLMTPVDREGIISKKYVGILILRLCRKVMTISKNLRAIIY